MREAWGSARLLFSQGPTLRVWLHLLFLLLILSSEREREREEIAGGVLEEAV